MSYPVLERSIKEKGFTVNTLLQKCGIKKTTMYNKINGQTNFTIDEAIKIKNVLGSKLDLEKLFQRGE